ncbi:MAG: ATP phosphoribosyltransferase [Eggerthellaceae bacterium]|jgi:ATP phosphoribosyltransferase regulatory subunit|nr:ATP phosphoribosyltransferase [Eggerthellaceae bacterium]
MNYMTPQGFRDVLADEAIEREQMVRRVQDLFAQAGYVPIETPTLENMAVMQKGGRVPASPFKFFDAQGNLVTMRPDVTLQVARMCATRLGDAPGPFRFRYIQRVFREVEGQAGADAREKKQIGIECIGPSGAKADAEVLRLFVGAMNVAGVADFKISIATVGVLRSLLSATGASENWKVQVLDAFHESNFVKLDQLCDQAESRGLAYTDAIKRLARVRGGREAIDEARMIAADLGCASELDTFQETYELLCAEGFSNLLVVDFSVMSSFDYYTGLVFEAFAPGLGTPLGSGGRYDNMLGIYGVARPAAGFAFYLEEVQAAIQLAEDKPEDAPLRIAVPKGSLNPDAIEALESAGLDVSGLEHPGRALIISNPGVDYIIVRPSDAPAFVALGAADCGICGEDSLIEAGCDVVELVDLRFGACRFIVAEPAGAGQQVAEHYRRQGSLRVATKYPGIAREHFEQRGIQVEIVKLHGNIELGPLTGVSECIVDITATGTTLRENDLVITDEVLSSTARFFANTASFRTDARVRDLAGKLYALAQERDLKVTAGGTK